MFVFFNFDDPPATGTDSILLLQNSLCLGRDIIKEKVYELGFLRGGWKINVMEQQDSTQIRNSERRRIKIRLQILVVVVHC